MSYQNHFAALDKIRDGLFTLTGEYCLVEYVPNQQEKKTASGIVVAETNSRIHGVHSDLPTFCRILLTGEGYYNDETKERIPLDVSPGDMVLVGSHSLKRFNQFGPIMSYGSGHELGLIKLSDIQMRFIGDNGYDKAMKALAYAMESSKECPKENLSQ